MLDCCEQAGVFLAHDGIELRGTQACLLQLLEGAAGVDTLMLTGVADDEHAILGADFLEESIDLAGAGKTRLVEQIEMSAGSVLLLLPAPTRKKTLQGFGRSRLCGQAVNLEG